MGDLSIEEARAVWKNIFTIWLNFKLVVGVTENIPISVLYESLKAIAKMINEYGRYPIE